MKNCKSDSLEIPWSAVRKHVCLCVLFLYSRPSGIWSMVRDRVTVWLRDKHVSEVCKQPDSTSLTASVHRRRHTHSHSADSYRQTCRRYMEYSGLFAAVSESLEGFTLTIIKLLQVTELLRCWTGVSRHSHCSIPIYMELVSTMCLLLHWKDNIVIVYQNM